MTAALAQAVTSAEAARIIAEEGAAALGADSAAVQIVSEERGLLELAAATGHLRELLESYGGISMTQEVPAVQAVRTGTSLWFSSAAELAERYPDHARLRERHEALGLVPLLGHLGPLGLLTVSYDRPRQLGEEDDALLTMLARQCGQALERARLYEREKEARENAERISRRLRQLQAIAEIGLAARSVDQLLEELLVQVREFLSGDRATILLLNEETEDLRVRAAIGIREEVRAQVRVPLGSGVAGRIAASGQPRIIGDLSQVDVVSAYLRETGGSLVGVPLRVENRVLGVLHVSADRKDAFDDDDLELLELAAERVALALERTALYEREHDIAVTLQRSVLPDELPEVDGLEVAARYLPGGSGVDVGGDWYDVIPLADGRIGVVVGDVVGKGVLAASTMAQLRNALRVYALEGLRPSSVLARLNDLARLAGTTFATVLYMVIDLERRTVRYSSAGHPPPVLVRQGWPAVFLDGGRSTPLGVGVGARFQQATAELDVGDMILLYTDGLVESRHVPLEDGLKRLQETVESGPEGADALLEHVSEELSVEVRQDDVALVALRMVEMTARRLRLRLPTEATSLRTMRHDLRAWLARVGAGEAIAHDILVAASEAAANAIEHPRHPSTSVFELVGSAEDGDVEITVRDFGGWKEPTEEADRGLGLRMMEALMDSVEVSSQAGGTEIRLRRRIAAAPEGSSNGDGQAELSPSSTQPTSRP
jgi:serine phosphatase RsbU (regulator of sigma subunit)